MSDISKIKVYGREYNIKDAEARANKLDTAGAGLKKTGTTIAHSNSVEAKSVKAFAQIAYDATGHITGTTDATPEQVEAINSGATAEKIAAIDSMVDVTEGLQAQIDQIVISSSSESVVAPEVAAARVGADSTEYNTLKLRLDGEYEATADKIDVLNFDVSELDSKLVTQTNNLYVPGYTEMESGYLATSSATTLTPSTGYYTLKVKVEAGTTYTITHQRHWGGYFDKDGNKVGYMGGSNEDFYNYTVTTPAKTAYMWVVVPVAENLSAFRVVEGSTMPQTDVRGHIKLQSYIDVQQSAPMLNLTHTQTVSFDVTNKTISIPQSSIIYGTKGKGFTAQVIDLTQTETQYNSWALLYDYDANAIVAAMWKGPFDLPVIGLVYGNKLYIHGVLETQIKYYDDGSLLPSGLSTDIPILNMTHTMSVDFDVTLRTITIPQCSLLYGNKGVVLPAQSIDLTQTATENNSWALLYDFENREIIAAMWKGPFTKPVIGVVYGNKLYMHGLLESQVKYYDDGSLKPTGIIPSIPVLNLTENQRVKFDAVNRIINIPGSSIIYGTKGKGFSATTIDLTQVETQNNSWALLYNYDTNDIIATMWKGPFDYPVVGMVYGNKLYLNGVLESQILVYTAGSEVCFFGDSITAGVHTQKAFHMYWADWADLHCKNWGVGTTGFSYEFTGSALAGNGVEGIGSTTAQTGDNTVLDIMKTVDTIDKCVIFSGTNDFGRSISISTFRASVAATLDYALTKTPYILVITPIMRLDYKTRVNDAGKKLADYSAVIKEECESRGISCIDGFDVALNPNNERYHDEFIPDGLHPNPTGHLMIARKFYTDFLTAMGR